jgi:hypothetical protein
MNEPHVETNEAVPPVQIGPISSYGQGQVYRDNNVTVDYLIHRSEDLIVFLDADRVLWFDWDNRGNPPGFDDVRARIAALEAVDTSHLTRTQLTSFKTLLGTAVVSVVLEQNVTTANRTLDAAQEYISARNSELARRWYLLGSFTVTGVVLVLAIAVACARDYLDDFFGNGFKECALGACAGGIGALFSILTRIGKSPLDVSAGRELHIVEGACRIAVGMIGAYIALLAFEMNLFFSTFGSDPTTRIYSIGLIGLVAGVSERLVPNLIRRVEVAGDGEVPQA